VKSVSILGKIICVSCIWHFFRRRCLNPYPHDFGVWTRAVNLKQKYKKLTLDHPYLILKRLFGVDGIRNNNF